jgi:mRNA-degrading endonuclease toxin of MazEF toxin-antitoxin module
MNRGDVLLVRFPHPSGLRGKKRPAVIVQSDAYAGAVSTLIVAEVTKNLTMAGDPACLFIDANSPEAAPTGRNGQAVLRSSGWSPPRRADRKRSAGRAAVLLGLTQGQVRSWSSLAGAGKIPGFFFRPLLGVSSNSLETGHEGRKNTHPSCG